MCNCRNCVISLAWKKKKKKDAIPFWDADVLPNLVITGYLGIRETCNGPFWKVAVSLCAVLSFSVIHEKKETYFNASTYHSTYDDMRNDDVIIRYGCIIATCVKVVMKTPLTVVLCIVCNIGTSTLCAYCIPPHGWWGQPLRFERDCWFKIWFCSWYWLIWSQTNSFVVCT